MEDGRGTWNEHGIHMVLPYFALTQSQQREAETQFNTYGKLAGAWERPYFGAVKSCCETSWAGPPAFQRTPRPNFKRLSGAAGSLPISAWHLDAPAPASAMSPSLAAGIYRVSVYPPAASQMMGSVTLIRASGDYKRSVQWRVVVLEDSSSTVGRSTRGRPPSHPPPPAPSSPAHGGPPRPANLNSSSPLRVPVSLYSVPTDGPCLHAARLRVILVTVNACCWSRVLCVFIATLRRVCHPSSPPRIATICPPLESHPWASRPGFQMRPQACAYEFFPGYTGTTSFFSFSRAEVLARDSTSTWQMAFFCLTFSPDARGPVLGLTLRVAHCQFQVNIGPAAAFHPP